MSSYLKLDVNIFRGQKLTVYSKLAVFHQVKNLPAIIGRPW
jgi:hypothetical protein